MNTLINFLIFVVTFVGFIWAAMVSYLIATIVIIRLVDFISNLLKDIKDGITTVN